MAGFWDGYGSPVAEKPGDDGGLVGFLRNAGSAIGSSFKRVGEGSAEVLGELTGVNQKARDAKSLADQEDTKTINRLGQKMKTAKTDEERERYRQSIANIMKISDQQGAEFEAGQNALRERVDPIKGAAAVGSIGLDVLSGGTLGAGLKGAGVLSKIAKGAGQGAAGGAGQGVLSALQENGADTTAEDIGGSALAGGLFGGGIGGSVSAVGSIPAAIARGLSKTSKKAAIGLASKGDELIASQINLTPREAKSIGKDAATLLGDVNRSYGIKDLNEAANISKTVTGQEGAILRDLTDQAVGDIRGVDVNLMKVLDDALGDTGSSAIPTGVRKNLREEIKNAGVTIRGGNKGSLDPLASPLDSLDQAKAFRRAAQEAGRATTESGKQLSKIYTRLAKSIEDTIDNAGAKVSPEMAQEASSKFLQEAAREGVSKSAKKAYEKLAKEASELGGKSYKDARALQQKWVQVGQIAEKTAEKRFNRSAVFGEGGKAGVTRAAVDSIGRAVSPTIGGVLSKVGSKAAPVVSDVAQPETQGILSQVLGASTRIPTARGVGETVQEPETVQEAPIDDFSSQSTVSLLPRDTSSDSPFSKDNIQKLIIADLAQGGKNASTLLQLYEMFGKGEEEGANLTAKQQETQARANAGLTALDQIEQAFTNAGGGQSFLGNLTNLAGSLKLNPEAEAFNATRNSAITLLSRALGGASNGSDKDRADIEQALPSLTDTPEAARIKLQALRDRLAAGSLSPVVDNSSNLGVQ